MVIVLAPQLIDPATRARDSAVVEAHDSVERIDLAVIGGGVAGTFIAHAMQERRPDWSIALFERTDRIGGRLRSVAIPGIEHKIELGGMRFRTGHRLVASLVDGFRIATSPFDRTGGSERSFLRGRFADGADDPASGKAYDLSAEERGRSATALMVGAFDRIVPGASTLDPDGYRALHPDEQFRGRRTVDWSIGDALATILSPDAAHYVVDAFGYDAGLRAFNARDAVEYLLGGGFPGSEARTPIDGMDRIPREMATQFAERGGSVRMHHQLESITPSRDGIRLAFASGAVDATRVAVTMPAPALRAIVSGSAQLQTRTFERIFESVEPFPAMKLYLWYERPWWRPSVLGIRATTDMPVRKVYYVDSQPAAPAALLAMYTDTHHIEPWRDLWDGAPGGSPASAPMLAAVQEQLRMLHPAIPDLLDPSGSALMFWGSDPRETGWAFWRPGVVSDEIIELAVQPDPGISLYVAGDSFSRSQGWVEGALETATMVVERLQQSDRS